MSNPALTDTDWEMAAVAYRLASYISYNSGFLGNAGPSEDDNPGLRPCDYDNEGLIEFSNPETLFIQNESRDIIQTAKTGECRGLTYEAAQVLKFVLNTPEEFRRYVCAKNGAITRYRLEKFLTSRWKSKRNARRVLDELETFTKEL